MAKVQGPTVKGQGPRGHWTQGQCDRAQFPNGHNGHKGIAPMLKIKGPRGQWPRGSCQRTRAKVHGASGQGQLCTQHNTQGAVGAPEKGKGQYITGPRAKGQWPRAKGPTAKDQGPRPKGQGSRSKAPMPTTQK